MQPCRRIGIDVTKRCQLKCKTCFYRFRDDFNANYHTPLFDLKCRIIKAKAGGCDSVVAVGWGEPMMYPDIYKLADTVKRLDMKFSIITNGCVSLDKYKRLYDHGVDHLHISVHCLGETLDKVVGLSGAHKYQEKLIDWLAAEGHPWRMNITMQKQNYTQIAEVFEYVKDNGCSHFVMLGFLPHYEWHNKLDKVAVHPKELRPYIEEAINNNDAGMMITLRYHPMCHLGPGYWPYVVNARYVTLDPWEWCYNEVYPNSGPVNLIQNALSIGESVAIQGEPCKSCALRMHCGGWNAVYAKGFNGAGLKAVSMEEADKYYPGGILTRFGGLHNLNKANNERGYFG